MRCTLNLALIATFALAACSPEAETTAEEGPDLAAGPDAQITEVDGGDIPAGVRELALATIPGMTIAEAERKERDGMVFWDVEGVRPDGSEVELDMLEEDGGYRVVEIQRDLEWSAVPASVRAAADAQEGMFVPARVIESTQEDGSAIFELFREGQPKEPAAEIMVKDGKAEFLAERWKY